MDTKLAEETARGLIQEYLGNQWTFKWDNAKARFGACHYYCKTISLSKILTLHNSQAEVLDTILHEIAHALAGRKAGHGPAWRKIALSIGSNGRRCSKTTKGVTYKFAGWCLKCRRLLDLKHRLSRSRKQLEFVHRNCGGRIEYTLNEGVVHTPADILKVKLD